MSELPLLLKTFTQFSDKPEVFQEACTLFSMTFDLLYTNAKARSDFFQELYQFLEQTSLGHGHGEFNSDEEIENFKTFCMSSQIPSSPQCLLLLEDSILQRFTDSLNNHPVSQFQEGLKWVLETPWLLKVIQRAIEATKSTVLKVADAGFSAGEVIRITSNYPVINLFLETLR